MIFNYFVRARLLFSFCQSGLFSFLCLQRRRIPEQKEVCGVVYTMWQKFIVIYDSIMLMQGH